MACGRNYFVLPGKLRTGNGRANVSQTHFDSVRQGTPLGPVAAPD